MTSLSRSKARCTPDVPSVELERIALCGDELIDAVTDGSCDIDLGQGAADADPLGEDNPDDAWHVFLER